jgi:hypothetical protein
MEVVRLKGFPDQIEGWVVNEINESEVLRIGGLIEHFPVRGEITEHRYLNVVEAACAGLLEERYVIRSFHQFNNSNILTALIA